MTETSTGFPKPLARISDDSDEGSRTAPVSPVDVGDSFSSSWSATGRSQGTSVLSDNDHHDDPVVLRSAEDLVDTSKRSCSEGRTKQAASKRKNKKRAAARKKAAAALIAAAPCDEVIGRDSLLSNDNDTGDNTTVNVDHQQKHSASSGEFVSLPPPSLEASREMEAISCGDLASYEEAEAVHYVDVSDAGDFSTEMEATGSAPGLGQLVVCQLSGKASAPREVVCCRVMSAKEDTKSTTAIGECEVASDGQEVAALLGPYPRNVCHFRLGSAGEYRLSNRADAMSGITVVVVGDVVVGEIDSCGPCDSVTERSSSSSSVGTGTDAPQKGTSSDEPSLPSGEVLDISSWARRTHKTKKERRKTQTKNRKRADNRKKAAAMVPAVASCDEVFADDVSTTVVGGNEVFADDLSATVVRGDEVFADAVSATVVGGDEVFVDDVSATVVGINSGSGISSKEAPTNGPPLLPSDEDLDISSWRRRTRKSKKEKQRSRVKNKKRAACRRKAAMTFTVAGACEEVPEPAAQHAGVADEEDMGPAPIPYPALLSFGDFEPVTIMME